MSRSAFLTPGTWVPDRGGSSRELLSQNPRAGPGSRTGVSEESLQLMAQPEACGLGPTAGLHHPTDSPHPEPWSVRAGGFPQTRNQKNRGKMGAVLRTKDGRGQHDEVCLRRDLGLPVSHLLLVLRTQVRPDFPAMSTFLPNGMNDLVFLPRDISDLSWS